MGIPPYKIAASMAGIVAQRLIRKICPKCRSSYYPTPEQTLLVGYSEPPNRPFTHGQGCTDCFDTGYAGRQGIYEVLSINADVREAISSEASVTQFRDLLRAQAGTTLLEESRSLAEAGVTTIDEVIRVALTD